MSASSAKTQQFLQYGQIIRIHGNQTGSKRGLIAVKGFTDLDAMYITFSNFRNIDVYRQSLFQILPRGVFEIHDEVIKSNIEKSKKKLEEKQDKKPAGLEKEDEEAEKNSILSRIQTEKDQYDAYAKSKMNQHILFGDDVIFKHVDSETYLSGSVRCSDGGLGSFKVELSESLSSMLVFKLLPFRSYEKDGDRIRLLGPIRIKNIENRCYLSREDIIVPMGPTMPKKEHQPKAITIGPPSGFEEKARKESLPDEDQQPEELHDFDDILGEERKQQSIIKSHIRPRKFNIVTTYSQSETWLIHLHQGFETLKQTQSIRTHDLIYLIHTQKDGYLAVGPRGQPILKQLSDNQYPCFSCLWQIQFFPLPRIQPPIPQDQSQSKQQTYSLRDILTSRLLKLDSEQVRLNTEVRIVNAKGSNSGFRLRNRDLVKIGEVQGAFNAPPKELDVGEYFKVKEDDRLNFMDQLPFKTRHLKLSSNQSEHGFRVTKIDDQTKKEVLFVLSTYEVLKEFGDLLMSTNQKIQQDVKARKLQLVDCRLCQLIAFIKQCDMNNIESSVLPKKKRQMILKDLEICKIIFKILFLMGVRIRDQLYKNFKKQNQLFKTVFNRCYYLILQIVRNNPVTKLYVCQGWMNTILDNAIKIEQNNTHIALNELLRSNQVVVDKFLTQKVVNSMISIFQLKPAHQKFLNILRSSCICNSKAIVKNQNIVLKMFFSNTNDNVKFWFIPEERLDETLILNPKETMIPFNSQQQDMQNDNRYRIKIRSCISKSEMKERTFQVLYKESEESDCSQTWNYFLAYMNLLADICFGRNFEAKKYVESQLTGSLPQQIKQEWANDPDIRIPIDDKSNQSLYILCTILEDLEIQKLKSNAKDVLRAVLRLINYAFVDTVKQNPIMRLSRLRNYNQVAPGVEINRTEMTEDNKLLTKVMAFLSKQIGDFRSFQKTDDKEKEFLLTVLDLLKSSLISGYWQKYEDMLSLLKPLLLILKNSKEEIIGEPDDVSSKSRKATREQRQQQILKFQQYKLQVKKPTPAIKLIIQCKLLACDIIQIILDFRTDLRVSHCTLIFKNLISDPEKYTAFYTEQQRDITVGSDTESIISFQGDKKQKAVHQQLENPGVWKHELVDAFTSQDELNILQDMNLNLVMVELSIYEDPELIAKSMNILKRIHQRTFEIMKAFTQVGILAGGPTQTLINAIGEKRKIFTILEDQNLLYSDAEDTDNNIIRELRWMAQACKIGFNLDTLMLRSENQNQISKKSNSFSIFAVFTERDEVHSVHQRLIKCLDIHFSLLKFINLCKGRDIHKLAKNILQAIYCFLIMLTKYNLQMKFEVAPYTKSIKAAIDSDTTGGNNDIGALQLLYQLYSNNKNNLHKTDDIEQLAATICALINNTPIEVFYKSKLMNFFHCLIYYNEDVIKSNQGAILAKLQDSKKTNIYFKVDDTTDYTLSIRNLERWLLEFQQRQTNTFGRRASMPATISESSPANKMMLSVRRKGTLARGMDPTICQVDVSVHLMYYITMFNTFSSLIQGFNKVNIGKCKQVHSYKFLLDILCLTRKRVCYPLRRNVRAYINRLYYIDQDYQNLNEHIINVQIPLIVQDLDTYIHIYLQQANLSRMTLSHPVRFQYFETYYYLYLEEILVTLHQILHKEKFKKVFEEELARLYNRGEYYLHYELMRIFQRLRYLHEKYASRFVKSFIRAVTDKIRMDYLDKFVTSAKNIFHKNQQGKKHNRADAMGSRAERKADKEKDRKDQAKRVKQLQQRSRMLINKLMLGKIESYFKDMRQELTKNYPLTFWLPEVEQSNQLLAFKPSTNASLVQKLVNLIYRRDANNQNLTLYYNTKLSKIKKLFDKPSFQLYLQQGFNEGCTDLFKIDQNSRKFYQFKSPFVSLHQYIKTIVHINTQQPNALSNDLKIFFFRVLRRFIEQRNTQYDGLISVDQWDNSYWQQDKASIVSAQKFLNESGIPQLIIESLKRHENLELGNEIILFAIAFILGGNSDCQNSILEKLKEDKKNQVFLNIQETIAELGKLIESFNRIKTSNSHGTSTFNFRLIDDYDYFHYEMRVAKRKHTIQPPGPHEISLKSLSTLVFKRIFRFLQLLCENNHVENKNYFRQQYDINMEKKINSINMIELATFEIRKLFKIISKDIVDVPLTVLDFINEINQIPCEENQKTLCKTTFFEDFCYMASYMSDIDNQKERRFVKIEGMGVQIYLEPLFQIYNKCINIVICVLQGNDQTIFRELSTKLQNKFLMQIINQNLSQLSITPDAPDSDLQIHNIINNQTEFLMRSQLVGAINVLIIIKKIKEFDPHCKLIKSYEVYLLQNSKMAKIHQALYSHMLKIQIKSNNKNQTVYFPKHPVLNQLTDQTRDIIMLSVGRQTQRQKLVNLFQFKQQVFNEIQHNFTISKKEKVLGFTLGSNQTNKIFNYSLGISMVINALWFFFSDIIIEYQEIDYAGPVKYIITILSFVQLFLTLIYLLGYVHSKAHLAACRAQAEEAKQREKSQQKKEQVVQPSQIKQLTGPKQPKPKPPFYKVIFSSIINSIIYIFTLTVSFLQKLISFTPQPLKDFFYKLKVLFIYDSSFKGAVMYTLISILGTFYQHYFFLLHQAFIFARIQTLDNVFKAVAHSPIQLISVSLLGVIFVYVFCVLGYDTYVASLVDSPAIECDGVLECIVNLYVSGTVGGGMENFEPLRFLYDLIYFVFFGLLFGNIISGIMIDTFAELRSAREQINKDKTNKCYICGIDRATLQKSNIKFEVHIRRDHFLWNYIFYLYCLKHKDQMDKSGLEYDIGNRSEDENDISWIPIYSEEDDNLEGKIEEIQNTLGKLKEISEKKAEAVKSLKAQEAE